ncbi:MAG: hypothetical protein JO263_10200 [Candidatus Eremiobacteraeota bacterium]|nr:hypothetical protein [Candidatus Eremiobacteraeota bacterium]
MLRCRALALCASLAACSGAGTNPTNPAIPGGTSADQRSASSGHISHVVIMIQENRSFDDLFATFPGADGTRWGKYEHRGRVKLQSVDLVGLCDWGHSYGDYLKDYNNGKMNGFGGEGGGPRCPGYAGRRVYQYVNPTEIAPYWDIASQYVLADHTFQTEGSGSFTAHQDLIRGATTYDKFAVKSLVDFPSQHPWGCDAKPGTKTSRLVWNGKSLVREYNLGPFPCTKDFPYAGQYYPTLRDSLDAKSVSWKYYTPSTRGVGALWNAFDLVAAVRYGPEWTNNIPGRPNFQNQIFYDISSNSLPAVSWVIPDDKSSDHPGPTNDQGPSWVASVVNAIGQSPYWQSTAIIIVWDDWGGFYDHVPPPFFDHWGGLGFRVPMLVVSAYARQTSPTKPSYISHTNYEFGSILKFAEDTFGLSRLGTTDIRANSISDCFDFTRSPRTFQKIPSQYSKEYFLKEKPSGRPIDSE